jgi:hypothetical protein
MEASMESCERGMVHPASTTLLVTHGNPMTLLLKRFTT